MSAGQIPCPRPIGMAYADASTIVAGQRTEEKITAARSGERAAVHVYGVLYQLHAENDFNLLVVAATASASTKSNYTQGQEGGIGAWFRNGSNNKISIIGDWIIVGRG
jgi:hypothetical protein